MIIKIDLLSLFYFSYFLIAKIIESKKGQNWIKSFFIVDLSLK